MNYEYLLFNFLVIVFPLGLSFFRPSYFVNQWGRVWLSIVVVAVPFLLWDGLVTGAHWHFNSKYILGYTLGGLPIEEILFFFTVPYACLFSWHIFFRPDNHPKTRPALGSVSWLLLLAIPLGAWCLMMGKGYTGCMLLALGGTKLWDVAWKTSLFHRVRFYVFLLLVAVFTLIFNYYLTARPVVLYGEQYQIGFRILTIPIEDFGYGVALLAYVTILYEALKQRDRVHGTFLERMIEKRFGGYRHQMNDVDPALPTAITEPKRVAVVGGGLAGMSAAAYLGQRGFSVEIIEKQNYLGGKAGAWTVTLDDGFEAQVEHGFHAFFRHYYNLNELLEQLGVTQHYKSIEDYMIITDKGETHHFKDVATTPVINLLSLSHHGLYSMRKVALTKTGRRLEAFLRYDRDKTFEKYDHISFAEFAEEAELPHNLMLVFNTFARAFFADNARISMAELIKSFHFYYLSNNCGLIYDYLDDDYDTALLEPFRKFYAEHNVNVSLDTSVESIESTEDGFVVNGEAYDYVVMATDVVGTRSIIEQSKTLKEGYPNFVSQVGELQPSQRYAVLRIWTDRDIEVQHPFFFITERDQILDAVTLYHRAEKTSAKWVEENGGAVFELHCYAVPDGIPTNEDIRQLFLDEFMTYFPELIGCDIRHEYLQVNKNFTAFHLNMFKNRPTVSTPVPGLFLAGDWVKMPYPSMLMEAACMSGLLAANAICALEEVQPFPVYSVPLKGILDGFPESPLK